MRKNYLATLSGDSSDSASATTVLATVRGLSEYDWFTVHANLEGATGGTLDVVLQRQITTDVWSDWIAFAQLADGAAAVSYAVDAGTTNTIVAVGGGTDSTPTNPSTLAAGTSLGGHPGDAVRLVGTTGSGTSAGQTQTVYLKCWKAKV